ncbi:MAG: hypothetical protein JXA20_06655 [Spirochaetes bacterium]|nr:hypothetical protein [Spirochaetota bacterium]
MIVTIDYVLMAICGVYGGVEIDQMIRGGRRVRPLAVIASVIVFILAAVATFKDLTHEQMRILVEGNIRG